MIPLYVENGRAYVWSAEDWHTLRTQSRICGTLIGSLTCFPKQNDFKGLPMQLMSEEAALLVENGICELHLVQNINDNPSEEEKEMIKTQEEKIIEEQNEAFKQKKIEQLSEKIDFILAGKKEKLLQKGITDIPWDRETLLQHEINKLSSLTSSQILVHLPTQHHRPLVTTKTSLDILEPSVVDQEGHIRYTVFKDLWNKGYYITNGSKFGSDYLVYPGDPVKFHATYMVRCIHDTKMILRPSNIVALGRLSVGVNKIAVLAFCNSYGNVEYQSLQWHDSIN